MDPATGRIRVRFVDVASDTYRTLRAYMIRLEADDFALPERIRALARAGAMSASEFESRFRYLVDPEASRDPA